jgi:hypothetical protein
MPQAQSHTYTIKAHPTMYQGTLFRSRLEAQYAAFFDLAEWSWEYEPIDLEGWVPDFRVIFPCDRSECQSPGDGIPAHALLVSVKPFFTLDEFRQDQQSAKLAMYSYGRDDYGHSIPADAAAWFGANPSVSSWEMCHGAGGGMYDIPYWGDNWNALWNEAGNITRWYPQTENQKCT